MRCHAVRRRCSSIKTHKPVRVVRLLQHRIYWLVYVAVVLRGTNAARHRMKTKYVQFYACGHIVRSHRAALTQLSPLKLCFTWIYLFSRWKDWPRSPNIKKRIQTKHFYSTFFLNTNNLMLIRKWISKCLLFIFFLKTSEEKKNE